MIGDSHLNNSLRELRDQSVEELQSQFWRLLSVYTVILVVGFYYDIPAFGLAAMVAAGFAVYDYYFTDLEQSFWSPVFTFLFVLGIVYAYRLTGAWGLLGVVIASVLVAAYILWARWDRYKHIMRALESQVFGEPLIDTTKNDDEEEQD